MAGEAPGLMYGPSPRLAPRLRTDRESGSPGRGDGRGGGSDGPRGRIFRATAAQCVCCDRDGGGPPLRCRGREASPFIQHLFWLDKRVSVATRCACGARPCCARLARRSTLRQYEHVVLAARSFAARIGTRPTSPRPRSTSVWLNTASLPQHGVAFRRPDLPEPRVSEAEVRRAVAQLWREDDDDDA